MRYGTGKINSETTPWLGSLIKVKKSIARDPKFGCGLARQLICGASLIMPNWMLSAAHCYDAHFTTRGRPAFEIMAGFRDTVLCHHRRVSGSNNNLRRIKEWYSRWLQQEKSRQRYCDPWTFTLEQQTDQIFLQKFRTAEANPIIGCWVWWRHGIFNRWLGQDFAGQYWVEYSLGSTRKQNESSRYYDLIVSSS